MSVCMFMYVYVCIYVIDLWFFNLQMALPKLIYKDFYLIDLKKIKHLYKQVYSQKYRK